MSSDTFLQNDEKYELKKTLIVHKNQDNRIINDSSEYKKTKDGFSHENIRLEGENLALINITQSSSQKRTGDLSRLCY
jgi:hypothetical protein